MQSRHRDIPVMLTMKISSPSGIASFRRNRTALALVLPSRKLTTLLELKKSLSTELLITYTHNIIL